MNASLRNAYHAAFVASQHYSTGRAFLLVDLMREHAQQVHAAAKKWLTDDFKPQLEKANRFESIAFAVTANEFSEKLDSVSTLKWQRLNSLVALRQIRLNKAVWGVRLP